jgi:uncharacterized protein YggU (UPF0235/DUF167 family)
MKISVAVHANSKKPKIVKNILGTFDVYVSQLAIDNRANQAIIKSLAKYFQVKTSNIQLTRGNKSKKKLFEIN